MSYIFPPPGFPPPGYGLAASVPSHVLPTELRSDQVQLTIRQQPKEAGQVIEGKEKQRKPIDPPPILQLDVANRADPSKHFMQSPYLFVVASLYKADVDEPYDGHFNKGLGGTLVSSLHRLKDINNEDGGFFVFSDMTVKVLGVFRLHFSLFEYRKQSQEVCFLGSVISERFKVLLSKDFKGLDESTYLSRTFSDQGVRIRLRKEPRSNKRNLSTYVQDAAPIAARPDYTTPDYYNIQAPTSAKRMKQDEDTDRKDTFYTDPRTGMPTAVSSAQYPGQTANYLSVQPPQSTTPYGFTGLPTSGPLGGHLMNPAARIRTSYASSSSYNYGQSQQMVSPFSQHAQHTPHNQQQPVQSPHNYGESSLAGLGAYRTSSNASLGQNGYRTPHAMTHHHNAYPAPLAGMDDSDPYPAVTNAVAGVNIGTYRTSSNSVDDHQPSNSNPLFDLSDHEPLTGYPGIQYS